MSELCIYVLGASEDPGRTIARKFQEGRQFHVTNDPAKAGAVVCCTIEHRLTARQLFPGIPHLHMGAADPNVNPLTLEELQE